MLKNTPLHLSSTFASASTAADEGVAQGERKRWLKQWMGEEGQEPNSRQHSSWRKLCAACLCDERRRACDLTDAKEEGEGEQGVTRCTLACAHFLATLFSLHPIDKPYVSDGKFQPKEPRDGAVRDRQSILHAQATDARAKHRISLPGT